jgi:hypothetical protein
MTDTLLLAQPFDLESFLNEPIESIDSTMSDTELFNILGLNDIPLSLEGDEEEEEEEIEEVEQELFFPLEEMGSLKSKFVEEDIDVLMQQPSILSDEEIRLTLDLICC